MINYINVDKRVNGKIEDIIKSPVTVYVNDFDEKSAKQFYEDFNRAQELNQEIIPIIIDSYGGLVDSLSVMIDIVKSSKIPVATIALGKAMSCGAFLLSCGATGMRYAAPNSRIMIHHVAGFAYGKTQDLKVSVEETERLQKLMFKIMDDNCSQSRNYFIDILKERGNTNWYLDPGEAKKHGLVDHIRIPSLTTNVSVKTELV